jgi:hypothetical protein
MVKGHIQGLILGLIRSAAVLVLLLAALLSSAGSLGAAGRVDLSVGFGGCSIMSSRWASCIEAWGIFSLWKKAGIHVGAGRLSSSWFIGHAVVADLGFWKAFGPDSAPSIVFFGASGSEGNPYEADLNGFGIHVGFRQECWFGGSVGVYGRGILRFWLAAEELAAGAPGLSGGLCFRF